MPETKVTVYEALRGAVGALANVEKDGFNKNQSFAFRSIEGTVDAARGALLENQLSIIPSFSLLGSTDWDRGEGKAPMHRTELIGTFRVVGPGGDSFEFTTIGEAVDYEGRSANKAMSAATKNALLRLLQIGSGEDGDAHDQHQGQSTYQAPRAPQGQGNSGSSLASTVAGVASTVTANQQTGEIRGITEGQGKNLYRLWKHVLNWDRDRFFQEIEIVTGAQITDDRKLTFDQASAMIKSLKERAGEEDTPRQQQGPSPRESEPDYDDSIF